MDDNKDLLWEDDYEPKEDGLPNSVIVSHKKLKTTGSCRKSTPVHDGKDTGIWKKRSPTSVIDDLWSSTEDEEINEDVLVDSLLVQQEGKDCILCQFTARKECIWDEVGPSIVARACSVKQSAIGAGNTLAIADKKARWSCHRSYVFQVSKWQQGMGRIPNPTCVVEKVHNEFPGDGSFTGYKPK